MIMWRYGWGHARRWFRGVGIYLIEISQDNIKNIVNYYALLAIVELLLAVLLFTSAFQSFFN